MGLKEFEFNGKKFFYYPCSPMQSESEKPLTYHESAIVFICGKHNLSDQSWAEEAIKEIGLEGFNERKYGLKGLVHLKMAMWESKIDAFIYLRRAKHFGNHDLYDRIKANAQIEQDEIKVKMVTEKMLGNDPSPFITVDLGSIPSTTIEELEMLSGITQNIQNNWDKIIRLTPQPPENQ